MLDDWAAKWNIPAEAMRELVTESTGLLRRDRPIKSEAAIQTSIRLNASRKGARLWRNNVGAYQDERGNHVRYGLCNESWQMNRKFKSSDLIGIRPRVIEAHEVGTTIGQFVAVEVKHGGWRPGQSKREQPQAAFIQLVRSLGGCACQGFVLRRLGGCAPEPQ